MATIKVDAAAQALDELEALLGLPLRSICPVACRFGKERRP